MSELISGLAAGAPAVGTDLVPIERIGAPNTNVKLQVSDIVAYGQASVVAAASATTPVALANVNDIVLTLNANTLLSFGAVPTYCKINLMVVQGAGGFVLGFPGNVTFQGGSGVLAGQSGNQVVNGLLPGFPTFFTLVTTNGGASWVGSIGGGTIPLYTLFDNFYRANAAAALNGTSTRLADGSAAAIAIGSSAQAWGQNTGGVTWGVYNGQAYASNSTGTGYATVNAGKVAGDIRCQVTTGPTGFLGNPGLAFRAAAAAAADANSGFVLLNTAGNLLQVWMNGALVNSAPYNYAANTAYDVDITDDGVSNINVYVNGALALTAVSAANVANTYCGLRLSGSYGTSGPFFDNFRVL